MFISFLDVYYFIYIFVKKYICYENKRNDEKTILSN